MSKQSQKYATMRNALKVKVFGVKTFDICTLFFGYAQFSLLAHRYRPYARPGFLHFSSRESGGAAGRAQSSFHLDSRCSGQRGAGRLDDVEVLEREFGAGP